MKIGLSIFLSLFFGIMLNAQDCNGFGSLCNKRYDEVVYLTTHNAFNYGPDFNAPNQNYPVAQQLADGVRALMLDIYEQNGTVVMYHGVTFFGQQPLDTALTQIKAFLDTNPHEIVTIIFESYAPVALVEAAFQQAQLMPYLHTQSQGQAWPSLQTMIDNGQRLVVMTDDNDNQSPAWYHYVWDFAVETHFSNHSYSDFDCSYNRGSATNSLFILNHFITDPNFGLGIPDSAIIANAYNKLYPRAQACQQATGKLPNFLTVDFYDLGDSRAVACALNGETCLTALPSIDVESASYPQIYPNPANENLFIKWADKKARAQLINNLGQVVYSANITTFANWDLSTMPNGLYCLVLEDERANRYVQKVIVQHL